MCDIKNKYNLLQMLVSPVIILLLALTATSCRSNNLPKQGKFDWPMYLHDTSNSGRTNIKMELPESISWTVSYSQIKAEDQRVSDVVISGNKAFFITADGFLRALDVVDGTEEWKLYIRSQIPDVAPCVSGDLVFSNVEPIVLAVSKDKPREIWRFRTIGNVSRPTTPLVPSHRCIYFGTADGNFYSISETDGHMVWRTDLTGNSQGNQAPCIIAGRVFIPSGGQVYGLDADSGSVVWKSNASKDGIDSAVVFDTGRLYFVGMETLYCLDAETGDTIWSEKIPGADIGGPIIIDNKVIIGGDVLYCMDKGSGELMWQINDIGTVTTPIVSVNGLAVFGTDKGSLHFLDVETHKVIRELQLKGSVPSTISITKDRIIVGSQEGIITCFGRK